MITNWKLFNFKSVSRQIDLELGALTIFAGSNSSGKSTILQSMLLVSQTLSSKVSSRSVILNGPMLRLGQFDDLKSFDGNANQIHIGFACRPMQSASPGSRDYPQLLRGRGGPELVQCKFSFDVDGGGEQLGVSQLRPSLFGCRVVTWDDLEGDTPARSSLSLNRTTTPLPDKSKGVVQDENAESLFPTLGYDVVIDSPPGGRGYRWEETAPGELVGARLEHFLPKQLTYKFDINLERARALVDVLYNPNESQLDRYTGEQNWRIPPIVFSFLEESRGLDLSVEREEETFEDEGNYLSGFLINLLRAAEYDGISLMPPVPPDPLAKSWWERMQTPRLPADHEALTHAIKDLLNQESEGGFALTAPSLPTPLSEGVRYIEAFFSNDVKYLGPLRDEPKPLYPLVSTADPRDIGLRGEHTASVLDLYKDEFVRYIPSKALVDQGSQTKGIDRSLKTAVLDWLQYMGVVDNIETQDRGKLGHELKVTTPGTETPHDLTHVGVGVSQVLPIVVMCLLAEPDTTIIIEQPELHLHPKVQTLLGDFFLSMALLGKQIIVETHSEYIVNRLRFRAAQADGEQLSDLMKIYFAGKDRGSSVFREVNVNRYGAILDWPDGFFDQSQQEAEDIVRAAAQKRRAERETK